MTITEPIDVLRPEESPAWFAYPRPFLRLVESGITNLDPWWIIGRELAKTTSEGLRSRYPARDLVPFAKNQANDDVACWERGDMSNVVVIHDFAAPGWEERNRYATFQDWLRMVFEEFIENSL